MSDYPTEEERRQGRRYLEYDHAARIGKGGMRDAANRHAQEIDEEHPRARDIAMTGTKRELGELPGALKAHQARIRKEAGVDTDMAGKIRHGYRTTPPEGEEEHPQPQPESKGAGRSGRASSAASSAGQSVLDAGGGLLDSAGSTSLGQLATETMAWGIGLSLLFLLLNRAGSLARLPAGAVAVTRAITSSAVDPLNPGAKTAVRKVATVAAAPAPRLAAPRVTAATH
ncbi:MAG: hypothetical protein ACR2QA_09220 [Solirubrobacteraceae bacterium]